MTLKSIAPPQLLTYDEASRCLHLSARTLRRLVEGGDIDCVRIGTSVRFTPQQLMDFVAARSVTRHS